MTGTLLFLGLGMQEILFIALIVLLFFGGKKIPELMKGLGKGVKSFKEGMNGVEDDIDGKDKKGETKSDNDGTTAEDTDFLGSSGRTAPCLVPYCSGCGISNVGSILV